MSDKLHKNRAKVFCPKCDELYIPQSSSGLDGAYFGSSLPHIFLKVYPAVIVLPPKVFFFEPRIYGFKIAGKRGSAYFKPSTGEISLINEK